MDSPITINGALAFLTVAGILWAIFSGLAKIKEGQRDTRILLNVICRHLNIDPEKILSGGDK